MSCSKPDTGYTCKGEIGGPSTCSGVCGDRIRLPSEVCDNGN
jgi:hypothetical protein